MGTQIHASDNYRRMVELIRRGAIGEVKKASVWCSRMPEGGSYLPSAEPAPDHLTGTRLALVAYRVGQKLEWDAANLKATSCPDADRYIRKQYRPGWVLNG